MNKEVCMVVLNHLISEEEGYRSMVQCLPWHIQGPKSNTHFCNKYVCLFKNKF